MPRRPEQPRVRIEFRDVFITADQLEQLRQRLSSIPNVEQGRVRLHNQVRFLPERPERYLLTDFAIEVNRAFEPAVRQAAEACGFQIRNDPWLIRREGVERRSYVSLNSTAVMGSRVRSSHFALNSKTAIPSTCSKFPRKRLNWGTEA